ncbi:MAG TPA: sensor domain-containing diguanylate cyclase [Gemmatimonadaceae bacterium]|jgi:diguanylate cyclase (GGDEF)-like protein/PAS domain S-box-containing protein
MTSPNDPTARFRSLKHPGALLALMENLRESFYILNARGEVVDANPAFLSMLGVRALDDLRSYSLSDMVADPRRRMEELETLDTTGFVRDFEIEIVRPDGAERTVLDSCYVCVDAATNEPFYHGVMVDITDRKRQEDALREQSVRDPLTGCYNRRYLEQIEPELESSESPFGCIFIDIDHFKQYNDLHGHAMGDTTLVRMSRFLMRQVRAEEPVIRLGGDEFLLVLNPADEDAVEMVARRLQLAAIRTAPVPFSLGWSARRPGESVQDTVNRADQRLLSVRVMERSGKRSATPPE